jgi:hypothetical protein
MSSNSGFNSWCKNLTPLCKATTPTPFLKNSKNTFLHNFKQEVE